MILSLRRYIYSNWKKFPSLKKAPKSVEVLGISGSVEGGTTTFLLFADNIKFPFGIVRCVRHPFWKDDLRGEWNTLGILQNTSLHASIPSPLFYEVFAGVPTLGESVLLGTPMQVRSRSNGVPITAFARRHFRSALDWLVVLHRETEKPSSKEISHDQIIKMIERCKEIFSLSPQEYKLLSEIIKLDALLPLLKRSFIVHGDFVPHNILLSKNGLRVIDWISSKQSPWGCFDIFSFSLVYALHARKMSGLQGYIKAFSNAFLSNNNFSNIIKSCLYEYFKCMNIEASHMRSLFVLFLVMKADEEYDRRLSLMSRGFVLRQSKNEESIWIYFIKHLLREKDSFIIKDIHE